MELPLFPILALAAAAQQPASKVPEQGYVPQGWYPHEGGLLKYRVAIRFGKMGQSCWTITISMPACSKALMPAGPPLQKCILFAHSTFADFGGARSRAGERKRVRVDELRFAPTGLLSRTIMEHRYKPGIRTSGSGSPSQDCPAGWRRRPARRWRSPD